MPTPTVWFVVTWAVVGAGLGRAFHPLADRIGETRRPERAIRSSTAAILTTAILFGLLGWRIGAAIELLAYSCVALASVPLTAIDMAELRLPRRLVSLAGLATIALFAVAAWADRDGPSMLRALAGMLVLTTAYLALALVSRGGLGAGDVRLAALVGLALGWRSWTSLASGTAIALAYAYVTALVAIGLRRMTRHSPMPYGPAMLAGAFTALLLPAP
jgi:leader peptidase (prepilin peptidase)/N-methyltransferase